MTRVFQVMTLSFTILSTFCQTPALAAARAEMAGFGEWKRLRPIPNKEGFASPFAGTSNGALIVAGGANFPEKRPWEGGTKRYYDSIFVLEHPDGEWKTVGKLPHPTAYGAFIDTDTGVLCIGGNGDKEIYADVYLLEWENGQIRKTDWPPLPQPVTMACAAKAGNTIFLACGNVKDSTGKDTATASLWSIDLSDPSHNWKKREDLPGAPRFQAVASAKDDAFYVFSGIGTLNSEDGKPNLAYLKDAFRYTPNGDKGKWSRLADLPHANAASPSPAPALKNGKIILIGEGAQGKHLDKAMQDRPLMTGDSIAYDTQSDTWGAIDSAPFGTVCSPVVKWNGKILVVNGEVRGGVRTPGVWMGTLPTEE